MSKLLFDQGSTYQNLAGVFQALSQPARLRILIALAERDSCVCHLEACLDLRQAYISQQMILLRQAGLVQHRREGKHIFYSLAIKELPILLNQLAGELNIGKIELAKVMIYPVPGCPCPDCIKVKEFNLEKEVI